MCGFVGFTGLREQREAILHKMADRIIHRGPDMEGYHISGDDPRTAIALGFRRLSIIDLAAGKQPMYNEDGTVVCVFNGEIYNFMDLRTELQAKGHIFKTHCDTEVIIHGYEEYGTALAAKLRGMFAFVVWDTKTNEMYGARDIFGIKPFYYTQTDAGELLLMQLPEHCTLCPRRCGANRAAGRTGYCGAGDTLLAARAALHHWEEPCLSGDPNAATGSGTVFFTGCTLQCCYCQNYKISQQGLGKPLTAERLAEIFMELQQKGAKNLNLVTATQWLPWVTQALDAARRNGLTLPVAYNTGGYETVETVKALAGYVDIWLADYKYASPALAKELSAAQDYPQVAHAAIRQMLLQTGAPVYDADGYLQKGVIVRHLALPGHSDDSLAVLQRLADLRQETGVSFVPSLMSQFTPFYRAAEHGLGRRITTYEYRKVVDRAIALGLTDGYMQEKSSAREEYTPPFDLEGV